MNFALLKVLDQTFVKAFYRNHSGLLLFFFIAIFSYFFFIKTAGDVTREMQVLYEIKLTLLLVTNPLMLAFIFLIWLIYTFKSWQFVAKQFLMEDQQFLFYSLGAISKSILFINWFLIQTRITLPIIVFGVFAIIIGIFNQQYITPLIIALILLLINSVSAVYYSFLSHQLINSKNFSPFLKLFKSWKKPFFSLFPYYILDQLKIALLLIKSFSIIIITGLFYYYSSFQKDLRLIEIAILMICTGHAFLIYHQKKFNDTFLILSKNLPYSRNQNYLFLLSSKLILLLPETFYLCIHFSILKALYLVLYSVSLMVVYSGILFAFGLDIKRYLFWVFGILIVFFLFIMFKIGYIGMLISLILSYVLFNRNYYKSTIISN
ncbi:MAG: hypothetical protein KJ712_05505 [Bacteroidetes bacterium]|nr:hypothetical protein [Bacteroidota bacterium]MBU1484986.1 hypothetical protein [Bacteroidota bacterium]MBU1761667.1 hypothetical protein [Bacteroidota bacterium]MBU2046167.1 hypothetical protein [Bacteroidota bacterium]MBU2268725.1 hypothetical protein [Bacteroidota bacterium]